jgi:hypothetical protein
MTYSIAAPLLYKEVVVNNLASFFLGVDNSIQPHHQNCIDRLSTQPHLCYLMRKKDGSPYICPRHKPHLDTASTATPPPTVFALYHKQELLAMVEALLFVYASADKNIYNNIDLDEWPEYGEHVSRLIKLCNVQRYEDMPECAKGGTGQFNPLPNLKRASVGRWTEETHWNIDHILDDESLSGSLETAICRDFEEHLAANFPPIRSRFFCRHDAQGPLSIYPRATPGNVELNILHGPNLHDRYAHLVVGALNVVHIEDQDMTGLNWIDHAHVKIASELYTLVRKWSDLYSFDVIGRTFFRFVIERDVEYDDLEEMDYLRDLLLEGFDLQLALLASLTSLPGDLAVRLDICWADEEGDCPACQPDTCHPAYKTDSPCNHLSRQEYDQSQKACMRGHYGDRFGLDQAYWYLHSQFKAGMLLYPVHGPSPN